MKTLTSALANKILFMLVLEQVHCVFVYVSVSPCLYFCFTCLLLSITFSGHAHLACAWQMPLMVANTTENVMSATAVAGDWDRSTHMSLHAIGQGMLTDITKQMYDSTPVSQLHHPMSVCDCSDGGYQYSKVKEFVSKSALKEMGGACECIVATELLVFPVRLGTHWACAVVDQRKHCITYFDSRGVSHQSCV